MRSLVLALVLLSLVPRDARGQYNVPRETTHDTRALEAPCVTSVCWCGRDQCNSYIIPAPSLEGSEVGASVDLDPADLAVLRTHGLVNVGRRAELFGGLDVLLWQPSSMHETRWQGVLAGVRARATPQVAGYARVEVGAGLESTVRWGEVEAAAQLRYAVPRFRLSWESALGGAYTRSRTNADRTIHLGEILAQTGLGLSELRFGRRWAIGAWWSLDLHVPVVDLPHRRLGMSMGVLVRLGGGLDVFFEQAVLDRGDHDQPTTMLPNLSDEVRWRVGFNRRFGSRRIRTPR